MIDTRTPTAGHLCRVWVRLYTRRLPAAAAERRREEIESDLFEHALDAQLEGVGAPRLNAEILARVLVGVPADLSWRRATRQEPHRRLALGGIAMSTPLSTPRRILYGLSVVVVLYGLVLPVVAGTTSFFVDWDDEPGLLAKLYLFGVPAVSTLVFIFGMIVHAKAPRRGLPFVVVGAIGPAVWYWMLPIYGPVMIAVIALAVAQTPRKRTQVAAV